MKIDRAVISQNVPFELREWIRGRWGDDIDPRVKSIQARVHEDKSRIVLDIVWDDE